MTDFASLGLRFVPVDDGAANKALTDVAANSVKAEDATKKLTATQQAAANAERALAQAAQVQAQAVGKIGEATLAAATQQAQAVKVMEAVAVAHGKVAGAAKITAAQTLNLSRQFADVAVTGAMGMSPLMILIQQGPQIGETIGEIAQDAGGLSGALRLMATSAWAAIAPFAGVGAVLGVVVGGFALFEREIDKNTKYATTWGDTWNATVHVVGDAIMHGPIGTGLRWLGKFFGTVMDAMVDGVTWWADKTVGHFGAAYQMIVKHWRQLPQVFGVIMQGAANISIQAAEGLINKIIQGVNYLLKAAGKQALAMIDLPEIKLANAKLAAEYDKLFDDISGGFRKGRERIGDRIAAQTDREYLSRQKATKAVKDHTAALKEHKEALDRTQPIAATMSKAVDLSEVKATKAIRKINGELEQVPGYIDQAVTAMEEFYRAANQAGSGVDQMFNGLKNRDWMSAVSGLLRAAKAVQDAFAKGGTTADKIGSIAGIAGAAGQAIGGTAGSTLSGAAAGAMAGFQLGTIIPGIGNVVGAIGGAIIGGIAGLLGGNSRKKAEKAAREQAAREAEAQRQAQILQQRRQIEVAYVEATGTALEILEARRKAELEGIDESNKAMALALYAAQDQKRRDEEGISLMRQLQAMDDAVLGTTTALTAAREDELKALDPANRYLAELIYKRSDEADLIAKTAAAAAEAEAAKAAAAEKAAATQATQVGLMRQLQAMDDAVLGTNVVLLATRADELAKLDEVSQGLQKIIWAREDEAKVIAANSAALEAANAKAAEMLKQRTSLEDQLLTAMGRTAEVTARQRASVIDGLDPSLRGLQSAYDALTDANARVTAAETGVADARSALTEAYDRESSALKTTIDRFKGFTDSLRAFRDQLMTGDIAANTPALQYSRTKADFERVAGLAAQGNEKALGDLQGVSEAYLKASGDYQRTNIGYFRDLSAVKIATKAAEGYASQQVDIATAQLNALNAQVSALGILNQSTLSVGQAVTNVAAAIDALARATAAKSAADAAAKQALSSAGVIPKASESLAIAANDDAAVAAAKAIYLASQTQGGVDLDAFNRYAGAVIRAHANRGQAASNRAGVTIGANDNADVAAAKAIYLSTQGGIGSDAFNRYVGANPFATMRRLGDDGDPEALRKKYNFGTGGSFTVGGIGSGDTQNFGDVNLSPGEVVNVSREDSMAAMVTEIRALRSEVASLRSDTAKTAQNTAKTANTLTRVTRDGDSLITEAA